MNNKDFSKANSPATVLIKHDRTAWLKGGSFRCQMPPKTPVGKPVRIILLGAPGVGKCTQAEFICDRLGPCHLSTGDVFRAAKKCSCEAELTPAMANALDYMKRGDLVPDETVLNMVGERLRCLECTGGFLLDGFPRTVAQAKALEQLLESHNIQLSAVINYDLPIEQIVARISGRRTCSSCKAVYHVSTMPPKVENVCDHCGASLFQREDDRPEAVKVRMEAYESSTRPLIKFYEDRGLLVNIKASGTPEEIFKRTLKVLTPKKPATRTATSPA